MLSGFNLSFISFILYRVKEKVYNEFFFCYSMVVDSKTKKMHSWIRYFIIAACLIGGFFAYMYTPLGEFLTKDGITTFVSSFGMFAPVMFILLYVILVLFLFPATIFSVVGGVLFGTLWGVVYVVIAATIAAGIGFFLARKYHSKNTEMFRNKVVKSLVKKCEYHCENHGFKAFFILRLLYLPYMPLSYAAGFVTTAKYLEFMIATFLTNIIGSFSFVYLGGSFGSGYAALLLPVVLIGLTLLVPRVARMFQSEK